MGHLDLARTAKTHATRSVALSWAALTAVLASIFAFPYGWSGWFIPVDGLAAIPVAMAVAVVIVTLLPLERVGDTIVVDLLAGSTNGRLRNVADGLAIAIGESPDRVVIHDSAIPNVGAFPTSEGVVVMATAGAIEQLQRNELEALVAAQFAGMRDPWCRLATRAELTWALTKALSVVSIIVAPPIALFVAVGMSLLPRSVEATRDLCADVAAVSATRHPAALANGLRHLAPAAAVGNQQRLVKNWYLPINPFLVMPKRLKSTTTVSVGNRPERTWTDADEVGSELHLRADRAEALASGADPRRFTGREYRRRWSQLGVSPLPPK